MTKSSRNHKNLFNLVNTTLGASNHNDWALFTSKEIKDRDVECVRCYVDHFVDCMIKVSLGTSHPNMIFTVGRYCPLPNLVGIYIVKITMINTSN